MSVLSWPEQGCCYWLTGLPAAGKSTLARQLWQDFHGLGVMAMVLDGDHLRQGLNADLGYGQMDRAENVRRIGEVARLVAEAGWVAIVSVVSPYAEDRRKVRERFMPGRFFEVWLDTDLQTCMDRDPKGLYRQAREGHLPGLTGFSAPYEPPASPELVIRAAHQSPCQAADQLIGHHALRMRAAAVHRPTALMCP